MIIYVLDDDLLMQKTLERALARCGEQPITFGSSEAFLAALPTLPFGCLLLDIAMPEKDGIAVMEELAKLPIPFPTIVISGSVNLDDSIRAFRLGAVHFLRKPYKLDDLRTAIEEARQVASARLAEHSRAQKASAVHLTAREREVLTAMVDGLQSKNIAWNLGLSLRTIEMHRSNVMAKLSARNASQAVSIARNLQLV